MNVGEFTPTNSWDRKGRSTNLLYRCSQDRNRTFICETPFSTSEPNRTNPHTAMRASTIPPPDYVINR